MDGIALEEIRYSALMMASAHTDKNQQNDYRDSLFRLFITDILIVTLSAHSFVSHSKLLPFKQLPHALRQRLHVFRSFRLVFLFLTQ